MIYIPALSSLILFNTAGVALVDTIKNYKCISLIGHGNTNLFINLVCVIITMIPLSQ